MIVFPRLFASAAFLFIFFAAEAAYCQTSVSGEHCTAYTSIARTDTSGSVPVIPAALLSNLDVGVPCLTNILESLSGSVTLPVFKPEVRSQFLSATGALRSIISKAIADDEIANKKAAEDRSGSDASVSNKNLRNFVGAFRKVDNLQVTKVLTYALRSDDQTARSNALLILSNVIDNATVCVAIDHLYDNKIASTPFGINGRANLLAVVSVVAPWAYRETYANIEDMLTVVSANTSGSDPSLTQTRDIISNIRQRLSRQTGESNQAVCLPREERDCYKYSPEWANKDQLRYPDKEGRCSR